jgi:hypothetical protein
VLTSRRGWSLFGAMVAVAGLAWLGLHRGELPVDVSALLAARAVPPMRLLRLLPPRVVARRCEFEMEAGRALLALDASRSLDEAEPALGRLLDAGSCDRIAVSAGPVPIASMQRRLDEAIRTFRRRGEHAAAIRWATDALSLSPDLGQIGGLEAALASIDLADDMTRVLAAELRNASPAEAARVAEVVTWARQRPAPLSSAIDREFSAISLARWPARADLAAHVSEATALERERRQWRLFAEGGEAPTGTSAAIDGAAIIVARDRMREIDRRSGAITLLCAMVASRPAEGGCLYEVDAMRSSLPKDTLAPGVSMSGVAFDAERCQVSIFEPDGSVAERYTSIPEKS